VLLAAGGDSTTKSTSGQMDHPEANFLTPNHSRIWENEYTNDGQGDEDISWIDGFEE
jgi:hypothetical protein